MEYLLLLLVLILLIFSPKTRSMLDGDNTMNAPEPKKERNRSE